MDLACILTLQHSNHMAIAVSKASKSLWGCIILAASGGVLGSVLAATIILELLAISQKLFGRLASLSKCLS